MRLRCSQLYFSFNARSEPVSVLKDVNFETHEGEFLCLVGPSGCGKTTLLRILAGALKVVEGAVEKIHSPNDTSSRVLLVYQEDGLFPWMNVVENAAFGLEMQGVEKQEREERSLELLQRFGLAGRERSYPSQLSTGMKQRVSVIRSFLSRPAVLLMDEPFAALDYLTRLVLQQELLQLWAQEKKSVVFVTHDIEEALLLSDRILVLSSQPGTILASFPVPFSRPRTSELTTKEEFSQLKRQVLAKLGAGSDDSNPDQPSSEWR